MVVVEEVEFRWLYDYTEKRAGDGVICPWRLSWYLA
jgi:hypothetical protein